MISAFTSECHAGSVLFKGAGFPDTKAAIHSNAGLTLLVCTSFPAVREKLPPSLAVQALDRADQIDVRNGLRCGASPAMKDRLTAYVLSFLKPITGRLKKSCV